MSRGEASREGFEVSEDLSSLNAIFLLRKSFVINNRKTLVERKNLQYGCFFGNQERT